MDAMPADAMQPHSEHTGRPPNWHGLTVVFMSAVKQVVTLAKMHSAGDWGGLA